MSCGSRRTLVYTHRYANAKERESPGNSLSLPPVHMYLEKGRGNTPPPPFTPAPSSSAHRTMLWFMPTRVCACVVCGPARHYVLAARHKQHELSPAVYVGTISIRPSIRVYPVVPSTWRSSLVAESPSMCPSPHLAPHNPAPPGQVLPASPTPPVSLYLQIVHPLRCTLSTVSWPPSSSSACPHRRRNP